MLAHKYRGYSSIDNYDLTILSIYKMGKRRNKMNLEILLMQLLGLNLIINIMNSNDYGNISKNTSNNY